MGYLLRGLRVASYLAAVLGLLLIIGASINNALFFYGIRFLIIGLVGIGATSLLRDRYLEGTEEQEYRSLAKTPKAVQSILSAWHALSTEQQAFLIVGISASVLFILLLLIFVDYSSVVP